jgi:hypothetical protein
MGIWDIAEGGGRQGMLKSGRTIGGQAPRQGGIAAMHTTSFGDGRLSYRMPASEVSRIAERWLKAHGDDAVVLARDMVAELEESGNINGASMWRLVIAAIEKLREARRK